MQDLRLLGVSEDGSRFVLQTPDGQTYGLRLDERLHAALRGDRARLGQLQIQLDHELRPREIQTRIRAGESAEEIASSAGVPVEQVRRFEAPVLLERTHVAELARSTNVRRVTDAAATPLGRLVAERLEPHGVAATDLGWDSWRRDDGRWLVRLTYGQGGRDHRATWIFDPTVRTIEPSDEEARWLTDEERAVPEHHNPPKAFVPRLASVPSVAEISGEQADDTDDEVDEAPDAAVDEPGDVDLTLAPVGHDPTWIPGFDEDEPPVEEPKPKSRHRRTAARTERLKGATDKSAEADGVAPGRRATVPSWDEILFGSSKPEE